VYEVSLLFRSVGHRVKTHKVDSTSTVSGNEHGSIEIKDYVVLSRGEDNHDWYGHTTHHTNGPLTHNISSTVAPHPDDFLKNEVRTKIRHYRQLCTDRSDPITFLPVTVRISGRVYDDFVRLFFFHVYREASI
jgi:hypothetical protein